MDRNNGYEAEKLELWSEDEQAFVAERPAPIAFEPWSGYADWADTRPAQERSQRPGAVFLREPILASARGPALGRALTNFDLTTGLLEVGGSAAETWQSDVAARMNTLMPDKYGQTRSAVVHGGY